MRKQRFAHTLPAHDDFRFSPEENSERKQRFAYTLPTQDDFTVLPEENDVRNFFQSQFPIQDSVLSQIFASPEQEPVPPYFMYQCPMIPVIQPEPFQSFASLFSSQSFQFHPFENLVDFDLTPLGVSAISMPISDSGFEDSVLPPEYYRKVPPPVQFRPQNEILAPEFPNTFRALELPNLLQAKDLPNRFQSLELPIRFPVPEWLSPYPIVTHYGTATILLRHLIRVDVAADKSVLLTNLPAECSAVMNSNGTRNGVIHPNGKVLHENDVVHMATLDKKAKISERGVVFTSKNHCLSYLVDASGTKTTSEKFLDLSQDFLNSIFEPSSSEASLKSCAKMAEKAGHKRYKNGDEVWMLGGIRIKQDQWGDVKVSRFWGRQVIQASPTTGLIKVNTEDMEISIGRYHDNYFTVRKGNQKLTASLKRMNVQSGTQKAGFDKRGRLVIK